MVHLVPVLQMRFAMTGNTTCFKLFDSVKIKRAYAIINRDREMEFWMPHPRIWGETDGFSTLHDKKSIGRRQ